MALFGIGSFTSTISKGLGGSQWVIGMYNLVLSVDPEVSCELAPAHFAEEPLEVSLPNMVRLLILKELQNQPPAHATDSQ